MPDRYRGCSLPSSAVRYGERPGKAEGRRQNAETGNASRARSARSGVRWLDTAFTSVPLWHYLRLSPRRIQSAVKPAHSIFQSCVKPQHSKGRRGVGSAPVRQKAECRKLKSVGRTKRPLWSAVAGHRFPFGTPVVLLTPIGLPNPKRGQARALHIPKLRPAAALQRVAQCGERPGKAEGSRPNAEN